MTLQRIVSLLKIKDNYVFKNIKFRKYSSFLSALLRILFRFKFIFRNYYFFKENVNIKSLNDFWMIRIGFNRKRNFLPYLNVDPHILNNPQLCSNLINLPFYSRTCQEIYVKHFFYYFS